jgi:hypothetical protein
MLDRRQFLAAAGSIAGAAGLRPLFADAPKFAPSPSFEPDVLFLTWQRDPTTTMTVQWIGTEEEGRDRQVVWYAKEGEKEWRSAASETRPFPKTERKIYRTELTGLSPGTDYRFRIGLDSAEKRFRTMPRTAGDVVQFISGGDAGVGPATINSNKVAASQSPSFVFMGGDLAYENGVNPQVFLYYLRGYSKQLIDSEKRLIPLLGCLGNHEVVGGYGKPRSDAPFFYSIFDGLFPETGYNVLDFGDYLSLVILDSNHTTPIGGEQTSWLERTLREREDHPNVLVYYHVPSYPSVRPIDLDHMEAGTGAESRKHWVPLFERYNVDVVFEHHDHAYKRTHPLIGNQTNENGVLYLGDGSWGRLRRPKTPEERPYLAVVNESYHLSLHRIEGDKRFHVALSDQGKVVDVCTTRKRRRSKSAGSPS